MPNRTGIVALALLLAACSGGAATRIAEARPGLLARAKVAPEAARKAALSRVPEGRITKGEIEEENGRLVYSFELKADGRQGIEEVLVDATTGDVASLQHESPARERAEAAAEK